MPISATPATTRPIRAASSSRSEGRRFRHHRARTAPLPSLSSAASSVASVCLVEADQPLETSLKRVGLRKAYNPISNGRRLSHSRLAAPAALFNLQKRLEVRGLQSQKHQLAKIDSRLKTRFFRTTRLSPPSELSCQNIGEFSVT